MKPDSPRAAAARRVGYKGLARRRRPPRSAQLDIMQAGIGSGRAISVEKAGGTWILPPPDFLAAALTWGVAAWRRGGQHDLAIWTRPEHLCLPPQLYHSDDPPRARRPR